MPRTVTGVMSAVFGTAQSFQARHGFPPWAIHLSDAISWAAGVAALAYFSRLPAWLHAMLFPAVVNAVAWLVTAIYFLIWSDQIHHFLRVRACLRELANESKESGKTDWTGKSDKIGEIMARVVKAQSFIQGAFGQRVAHDFETFKDSEIKRRGSNDLFPVIADFSERLAREMAYADLNPHFDPPRSYAKFKGDWD